MTTVGPETDLRTRLLDRLESGFAAFAAWVLRRRALVALAVVGLTAAMGALAATRLRVDATTEGLLGSDTPAMRALDAMHDDFGPDKSLVFVVTGDLRDPAHRARLQAFRDELEGLSLELPTLDTRRRDRQARGPRDATPQRPAPSPDDPFGGLDEAGGAPVFVEVTSALDVTDVSTTDGALEVRRLGDLEPADLAARIGARDGALADVVAPSGRASLVVARPRFMDEVDLAAVVDATAPIVARARAAGLTVERTGIVSLEVALNRIMTRDIGLVFGLALVAMIGVLAMLYRRVLGVVAPIVVIVLSIVVTHGAMALAGAPVTGVTSVLGTMLLVIGMADAVHVVSATRDGLRAGLGRPDAIVDAVRHTAWPITFTAITDVVGLISFRTSDLAAIRDMGTFGCVGILAALAYTLTLLPVLLSLADVGPSTADDAARSPDLLDRLLARSDRLSRPTEGTHPHRARNRVLVAAAVFTAASLALGTQVRTVHDPLTWLAREAPERRAVESLEAHGFGAADVELVVRLEDGHDLREPAVLHALERVERAALRVRDAEGAPLVRSSASVLDPLRDLAAELSPSRSADDSTWVGAMTVLENASPRDLGRVATADLRTTRMTLSVRWMEASAYGPFARTLEDEARRAFEGLGTVHLTGAVYTSFAVVSDLNTSLRESFAFAVIAIAFTMMLLVFDVRLGLLSMVPNLVPIVGMLGAMGALGWSLDLNGLLVSSIAMGLVVDDTIHVVHDFARARPRLGTEAAVRHVFLGAGRALVTTSLVLALGFAFFLLADLENVRRFGGQLALTILVALVGDLVLTPAILRCSRDGSPTR